MSAAVDPAHAHLPLPGARAGAGVIVEPLRCGEASMPPGYLDRPSGPLAYPRVMLARRASWLWVPIPVFLVRHPQAGALLIDTGLHASVAVDPVANLGPLLGRVMRVRADPASTAVAQLSARGIEPREIGVVIMTHLHFDHASAVVDFPAATFVVDRAEWDGAVREGQRGGYHARQFDHAFDWQTIDFESRSVDSFATFGRAVDLFGDGSVRLLSTPGHSAGHMSVLLRLAGGGELLVCGDAIYTLDSVRHDLRPLVMPDQHLYERSRQEIRLFARQTPGAVIVAGHDAEMWPQLERRYGSG